VRGWSAATPSTSMSMSRPTWPIPASCRRVRARRSGCGGAAGLQVRRGAGAVAEGGRELVRRDRRAARVVLHEGVRLARFRARAATAAFACGCRVSRCCPAGLSLDRALAAFGWVERGAARSMAGVVPLSCGSACRDRRRRLVMTGLPCLCDSAFGALRATVEPAVLVALRWGQPAGGGSACRCPKAAASWPAQGQLACRRRVARRAWKARRPAVCSSR
jgi:hypothetical protein